MDFNMQKLNTFLTLFILFSSNIQASSSKKQKPGKSPEELNALWLSQWHPSYNVHIIGQLIKDDKLHLFQSEKSEAQRFNLILKAVRSAKLDQASGDKNANDWTSKALEALHKASIKGNDLEKIRKKEIINQINQALFK
jgi:hypothetical protein